MLHISNIFIKTMTMASMSSFYVTIQHKRPISHDLRFIPSKTTYTTFGTNHLTPLPARHICHNLLTETKQVTYLGTVLSNDMSVSPHIDARIKAVRCAFYRFQGAGLSKNGVNAGTLRHIFNEFA